MYGRNFGSLAAVCLVALFLGAVNAGEEDIRITRGNVINIRQAPYTVQLRYDNQVYCGAALVNPLFVVAPAHCFDYVDYSKVTVVAGATTTTESGEQRKIFAFDKSPLFNQESLSGDVAILKLDSPMPINERIQKVNLCSAPVPDNILMIVTGWLGKTKEMHSVQVPKMNHEDCKAKIPHPITNLMLCAQPTYEGFCDNDAVGAAIYAGELCGIGSFGAKCSAGLPNIYTDVFAMRDYIRSAMLKM